MFSLIACIDRRRAIGLNGHLLYHIPQDMAHFKQLTMGHTVVMGRLTWQSLRVCPLPNRRNIVVSTTLPPMPGAVVVPSWEAVSELCPPCAGEEETFIIGGASLYAQALPFASRLHLTIVDDVAPEADAFFPPFNDWNIVSEERHTAGEEGLFKGEGYPAFSFVELVRKGG